MQAIDLRLLRGAAIPTAVAAVVAMVVAGVVFGGKGSLGAAFGAVIVAAFFTVSLVAVAKAGQVFPQLMLPVALGTYAVKMLVIFLLIGAFVDARWMEPKAFAFTVVGCTIVWMAGEVRTFFKQRILYVDPTGGEQS